MADPVLSKALSLISSNFHSVEPRVPRSVIDQANDVSSSVQRRKRFPIRRVDIGFILQRVFKTVLAVYPAFHFSINQFNTEDDWIRRFEMNISLGQIESRKASHWDAVDGRECARHQDSFVATRGHR